MALKVSWRNAAALAAVLAGASARAQSSAKGTLDSLASADRIVLVQFRSDRCKACPEQSNAIERISRDRSTWVPAVVQVNLDKEKELKERFSVTMPATLLLLRGERELSRAVNLSSEEQIRGFVAVWASRARGTPRPRPKRKLHPRR